MNLWERRRIRKRLLNELNESWVYASVLRGDLLGEYYLRKADAQAKELLSYDIKNTHR